MEMFTSIRRSRTYRSTLAFQTVPFVVTEISASDPWCSRRSQTLRFSGARNGSPPLNWMRSAWGSITASSSKKRSS